MGVREYEFELEALDQDVCGLNTLLEVKATLPEELATFQIYATLAVAERLEALVEATEHNTNAIVIKR